jgi:tRNA (guanine-N7-)-methyltransferase
MARRKLKHFAEMAALPNVLEYPENMPGKWAEHFGNNNPLVLELGCGTGAYTISLAERYPDKNFIGVDIKGARMWHGATAAHQDGKTNVAFLRIVIENIAEYFAPNEVSEIWITFPDPHPREGKARKRLCSPRFHEIYRKFIQPVGKLHLKTDNQELF